MTGIHNYEPNQRVRIVLVALALPADEEEAIVADHNSAMLTGAMCASDAMLLDWRYTVPLEQSPVVTLGPDPSEDDAFLIAAKLGMLTLVEALPRMYLTEFTDGTSEETEGPFATEKERLDRARERYDIAFDMDEDVLFVWTDVYHDGIDTNAYSNGELDGDEEEDAKDD